jgi:DNA polymerase-3 subunit epsilon
MRQVVLDTETTGLEVSAQHRIIEIGAVEVLDRKFTGRQFHKYINPQRDIDDGAFEVHGISSEFLSDKPVFTDIRDELMEFLRGADLVIHNAPFDVAFLNYELSLLPGRTERIESVCGITDSLALARHRHPGQKNSLDALCRRYGVDNSARKLHGALLDAEILADVYLLMTGGQTALFSAEAADEGKADMTPAIRLVSVDQREPLKVISASADECAAHEQWLDELDLAGDTGSVWRALYGSKAEQAPGPG